MTPAKTPSYIKSLLSPQNGKKAVSRKVWSVDLEMVWLPFFTATNTTGETSISHEALGAPLRLAYDKDGAVKFSNKGRPVFRVADEIGDNVKMIRENFVAGLQSYAQSVKTQDPEGYKGQIEAAHKAGQPILEHDGEKLQEAVALALEQANDEEAASQAEPTPAAA